MINNTITLVDALLSLIPNAEFGILGDTYEGINWLETNTETLPTEEELENERTRLQIEYNNLEYQRLRRREYPELSELADALYWNSEGDSSKLENYFNKCREVKSLYPKPTLEP